MPLSNGTIIPLRGKEYRILNVIGDGASCIVYSVCATNQFGITQHYRLKECYPYHAQCHRERLQLVWDDEAHRQSAFERFTRSAKMIADLRNEESIGNHITGMELIEGNGTLYALMEVNHAQTYQQDQTQDLHRILQTMLKLTRIVGRLHDQGYLHLDIKPENFLVSYDPEPNIWLFDVDSLVVQAELHSGRTTCYSYSREWAAPELTQGKLNKICFATDLFSIGAILFNKVMSRPVCNDDIGLFPDWNFDGKLFEDVNPRIKLILQRVFEKTLSATVKCRYQIAAELCEALEKACEITVAGKPFVQTDLSCLTNDFIGREYEISKIEESLQGGNTVFLHGFGGIGKSSLAVAYAHQHQKQYAPILFLRYQDSLKDLLLEIDIQHFDGSDMEKLRLLKRLLDKDTLLIVDNYDVAVDEDDYLDEFLRLPAKKIFTTRTDFANVYSGQIHQIEITPLPMKQLLHLFSQSSKIPVEVLISNPTTEKLLKAIAYHTLSTILMGRQMAASGWSIEGMYEQYTNGFAALSEAEDTKVLKDGRTRRGTIPDHIRILLNMASLTSKHKDVLRNLYVLSQVVKISKESYRKFITYSATEHEEYDKDDECWRYSFSTEPQTRVADFNALNDLEELGWVQHNYWYGLHPLVEELVFVDLMPNEDNCPEFYRYIRMLMKATSMYDDYGDDAVDATIEQYTEFLCHYFSYCDYRMDCNLRMCVEWMADICYGHSIRAYPFGSVYEKLAKRVYRVAERPKDRFKICCIMLSGWLADSRWSCREIDKNQVAQSECEAQIQYYFSAAKNVAIQLDSENPKTSLDQLYSLISRYANDYYDLPEDFLKTALRERPDVVKLDTNAKKRFHIQLSDAEQLEEDARHMKWENDPELQEFHRQDEIRWDYQKKFRESTDKLQFAKDIIADASISPFERARRVQYCTREIFERLRYYYGDNITYLDGIGWSVIGDILEVEEEWLFDDSWSFADYDEMYCWKHWRENNSANGIVTYAMLGWPKMLRYYWDDIEEELANRYSTKWHWAAIVREIFHFEVLSDVINMLKSVQKVSYILLLLVEIVEKLEAYAKTFLDYEDQYMYPLYRELAECAEVAWFEKGITKEQEREFEKIREKYQEKADAITGKDYVLIWDD
jgi:serine/threonine protein kinase